MDCDNSPLLIAVQGSLLVLALALCGATIDIALVEVCRRVVCNSAISNCNYFVELITIFTLFLNSATYLFSMCF